MKLGELNENQKIGLEVLKVLQTKCSSRFNTFVKKKLNLAYQASLITSDYEDIANKVHALMYRMDMCSAFEVFIKNHGDIEVTETPVPRPAPIELKQEELFTESKPVAQNPQIDLGSTLGLLEKTLAEVIVKNRGEEIKNEIVGDFQKQVRDFIKSEYGTIQRKVEVEVGEVRTSFDEVLHEKFDTVLKFVQMDEPVFLTGRAGTGKNVLCKQVAKALGLDFYFTNAVTQEYKLTGFTDANGIYHQTQFYEAFTKGGLFMLDEMDASIPEVLVILNCAIANRYFDFPSGKDKDGNEIGGFTKAHPDFRVISAGNTFGLGADYEYVGRNQLDMASLNRFAVVEIDYDKQIEYNVSEGDSELVDFCEDIRKVANDSGIRIIVSYRDIGRIAKMQKLLPLNETLKTCLIKNLQKDDIKNLLAGSRLPNSNKYRKVMEEMVA